MSDKEIDVENSSEFAELAVEEASTEDEDLDEALAAVSTGADLEADAEESDDDEDEEEEDEEDDSSPEFESPMDQLFFRTVKRNATRRETKLRVHLPAPIQFKLKGTRSVYSIDWSREEIQIAAEPSEKAACSIDISEDHLLEISEGQLNPQVAMLSEKVTISGDMGMAMYAFNLFVRRGRRN